MHCKNETMKEKIMIEVSAWVFVATLVYFCVTAFL